MRLARQALAVVDGGLRLLAVEAEGDRRALAVDA